jgi:pimeloyl-ACP methyl ester carboxylesterase
MMKIKTCQYQEIDLTYRVIDDAKTEKTLVCLGGLGGTFLIWSSFVRNIRDRYRIIIWDYPGLSAGTKLPDDVSVEVSALTTYLEAVLDAEGVDQACLIGWSLGSQVAMEYARLSVNRIQVLVSVCGLAGQPFVDDSEDELLRTSLDVISALPQAIGWISKRLKRIDSFRARLRDIEHPTRWAKTLGLVDPIIDEIAFDAVIRDFLALDIETYNRYAFASGEHDATDILEKLDFPVLVIAGEQDRFVSEERMKKMAAAIPGAEYFEVNGATHYLPLEYGPLLALKIDDFIKRKL